MHRRRFLATTGMALVAGLAGCSGDDSDDNGDDAEDPDSPEDVVQQYVTAMDEGDRDRLETLTHPESPGQEAVETTSDQELAALRDAEVAVGYGNTTVDGDTAFVEMTMTIDRDEETTTFEQEVELRRHEDAWRIWDAEDISA